MFTQLPSRFVGLWVNACIARNRGCSFCDGWVLHALGSAETVVRVLCELRTCILSTAGLWFWFLLALCNGPCVSGSIETGGVAHHTPKLDYRGNANGKQCYLKQISSLYLYKALSDQWSLWKPSCLGRPITLPSTPKACPTERMGIHIGFLS